MTEWWTYRPSDFLLFSARTYYRLFELYNADAWPGHLLALGLALVLWLALLQGRAWAPRAACALLATAWLWVAWAFHGQRYAAINWAATWFAAAFAVQGLLLLSCALVREPGERIAVRQGPARSVGLALLLFALVVQPTLGVLLLRPARTPSGPAAPRRPALAWRLWPIPLLWCAVTGMTLATMQAADALLMPAAALLAVVVGVSARPATVNDGQR